MTAPRPAAEAALAGQARRRRRAARHAAVMGVGVSLLVVAGFVAAGAALGRWELPFVDEPERRTVAVEADAPAGPMPPVCGPDGTARVAAPGGTELMIMNGTVREGLAGSTGEALAERGFTITGVGNTELSVSGASRVRFPPDLQAEGLAVAVHTGAPDVLSDSDVEGVVLVLGPEFSGLRTVEQVDALLGGAGEIFAGCLAEGAQPPPSPAPG